MTPRELIELLEQLPGAGLDAQMYVGDDASAILGVTYEAGDVYILSESLSPVEDEEL